MKYGLFDTKAKQWLSCSNQAGPNEYDDKPMAKIAALVATEMLKLPIGQIRAAPLPAEQDWRLISREGAKYSGTEAIKRLERKAKAKGQAKA